MAEQKQGYPQELLTIGDHIRKRRMDLGLLQKDVAAQIGVAESTIWNWEHGGKPEVQYHQKINDFLGFNFVCCPGVMPDSVVTY